jgi:hypothetical protein
VNQVLFHIHMLHFIFNLLIFIDKHFLLFLKRFNVYENHIVLYTLNFNKVKMFKCFTCSLYRWFPYLPSQEYARTSCVSFIDTPLMSFSLSLSFVQLDRSGRDKDSQIFSSFSSLLDLRSFVYICGKINSRS